MDINYAEYLIRKTEKDYNLIAEDFSRTRQKVWEEINFLFDRYLKESDKVLDIGCGNARFYPLFKKHKVEYIGIDNSEKLVKLAKERFPQADIRKVNTLNLPFPDYYFDKVYAIAVFHHIPGKHFRKLFLKEVKRVLKNKGLLIITVWKPLELEFKWLLFKYTLLKLIGKTKLDFRDVFVPWKGREVERYYHFFSVRELKKIVKEMGFKIIECGIARNKKFRRQNIYLVAQK